ncbi:MAG: hypothetical protein KatS3mg091_653 [Patescibacteria group bacterium]|nr:MAG: hypothetical protein KatS3mg091_653 [Patescibacteria group bacterium]
MIRQIIANLTQIELIKKIYCKTGLFHDEPKIYHYETIIDYKYLAKKNSEKYYTYYSENDIIGSGISFFSKEEAIQKSLSEAIERLTFYTVNVNKIITDKTKLDFIRKQQQKFILKYKHDDENEYQYGLIKAKKLNDPKNIFYISPKHIYPYYLRYLMYKKNLKKINIYPIKTSSNGLATHIDLSSAIINGIYEVIERDAFIDSYISNTGFFKVKLTSLKNNKIKKLDKLCKKYLLKWLLFYIETNLKIPTFLSLLIDQSEKIPMNSFGIKSNLNPIKAIIGSLEEAFIGRHSLKILSVDPKLNLIFHFQTKNNWTILEKFLFEKEYSNKLINLLKKAKGLEINLEKIRYAKKQELLKILNILQKKNIDIYYVNLSLKEIKNYFTIKIIAPKLKSLEIDISKYSTDS